MNKQDQMTMQEAERKMESLREVFQVVRLVDGKMLMDREKRINAGDLSETCQCYSFWKKDKECENCSSLLALKEQTQKIKFEFLDLQVFQMISRYVEIDGRPYVMEMIQNLDESIQIDQEGYDKLISKLSGYNEKLYTDVMTGIYNRRFFEEKIKNGGFEVVKRVDGAQTDGMTKELNEILSSGTKVEVIMCADDQMAEAVRATVKESGKNDILIYSIGGSPAAKAALLAQEGAMAGIGARSPIIEGKIAVKTADAILDDGSYEEEVLIETFFINKENVEIYGTDGWQ